MIRRLPEARAVAHGTHLSLEVRKRRFGWFLADHHGDGRVALHCKATAQLREHLRTVVPQQLHVAKYLGRSGWVGLWLDVATVDWPEVERTLRDAYLLVAPKSLASGREPLRDR